MTDLLFVMQTVGLTLTHSGTQNIITSSSNTSVCVCVLTHFCQLQTQHWRQHGRKHCLPGFWKVRPSHVSALLPTEDRSESKWCQTCFRSNSIRICSCQAAGQRWLQLRVLLDVVVRHLRHPTINNPLCGICASLGAQLAFTWIWNTWGHENKGGR